jgi:hypothetical protein
MTDERSEPQYVSEVFRTNAKEWVELDKAARMLEECKSSFFSQRMLEQGDIPVNRAEINVKASEVWTGYLESMVKARSDANLLKVKLEYLRMRFQERMSQEANARAERKL